MRLNQNLKKQIKSLKKEVEVDETSLPNYYKYYEKKIGRPADMGELLFSRYFCVGYGWVTSNRTEFLFLSHEYFGDNENPVKERWRKFLCNRWWHVFHFGEKFNLKDEIHNPEYVQWFQEKWELFLQSKDLNAFLLPEIPWTS